MKHLLVWGLALAVAGCCSLDAVAQIHGLDYWDHWQLGNQVSVNFPNGQAGTAQFDAMPHREVTRLTICDPISGNILFSYDGDSIRGADNSVIPHAGTGGFIDWSRWIAHPGDAKIYYLFVKQFGGTVGWRYTTVRTDNGILPGEADAPLGPYDSFWVMEAISSPDGATTWAVTHDMSSDAFRLYRIASPIGLDTVPTLQHVGPMLSNVANAYYMRVSPDNTKLALTSQYPNWVTLFDVDPAVGILSNPVRLSFSHETDGAEFSPNSRYLYVFGGQPKNIITQIDLAAGDSTAILQSAVVLPLDTSRFKMYPRLGTDSRIYIPMDVGITSSADRFARVLDPDQPGLACNTDSAGLMFPVHSEDPLVWNYWPFTPIYMGTPEYQAETDKLRAWPLPATNEVSIDAGTEMERASVNWIDATGRIVRSEAWPAHSRMVTFARSALPGGSYIIEVRPDHGAPRRAKVLLE